MPKMGKSYNSYEEVCEDGNGCWNCERGCIPNGYDYGCPWKEDREKGMKNLILWGTLTIKSDTKQICKTCNGTRYVENVGNHLALFKPCPDCSVDKHKKR